jgi:hypothetical protein
MIDIKALAIQLRGAAEQLDQLADVFGSIGGTTKRKGRTGTRKPMSAASRKKISDAARARWAKQKKSA